MPIYRQVWEARPHNIPPTCLLDKILVDLVDSGKVVNAIEPDNTPEFSSPKFPSVAALFNPRHHVSACPMASKIASVSGILPCIIHADETRKSSMHSQYKIHLSGYASLCMQLHSLT
jgi:hypothetical protein